MGRVLIACLEGTDTMAGVRGSQSVKSTPADTRLRKIFTRDLTNDVVWRTMQNGTDKGVFHVFFTWKVSFFVPNGQGN